MRSLDHAESDGLRGRTPHLRDFGDFEIVKFCGVHPEFFRTLLTGSSFAKRRRVRASQLAKRALRGVCAERAYILIVYTYILVGKAWRLLHSIVESLTDAGYAYVNTKFLKSEMFWHYSIPPILRGFWDESKIA